MRPVAALSLALLALPAVAQQADWLLDPSPYTAQLREETGDRFPEKVTAFRPGMAAHGKYGEPCPECGDPIQRIVYASRETNYCARCQTGGKLLADRALSRLLKGDWPKSLSELDEKLGR